MANPRAETVAHETPLRKPEFVRCRKWVTARRVEGKGELVETVDGETWAKPGDWVLTESMPLSAQHVLPDWKFREEYEPTNEEAKDLWHEESIGATMNSEKGART